MLPNALWNLLVMCANVGGTVGIVLVNKLILREFPYAMSLTLCHQLVAGVILSVTNQRCCTGNKMPQYACWWYGALSIVGIYSQNLSLRINSVTLYQICKLMNIPAQCLYQYLVQAKVFTRWVYGSLVVLTLGVALTTIAELDIRATAFGLFIAAFGVLCVVLDQGEFGRLMAKHDVTAPDLLLSSNPHRILVGVFFVLVMERDAVHAVKELPWRTLAYVLLSCCLATTINVSAGEVIRVFGAVTKAVLGHAKTISILAVGLVMHPPAMDWIFVKHFSGIFIALTGAMKYGQYTGFPEADCFARCRPACAAAATICDVEAEDGLDLTSKTDVPPSIQSLTHLVMASFSAGFVIFTSTMFILASSSSTPGMLLRTHLWPVTH
mmetsp:Transcript_68439/g.130242  ORF Transcript_68439/g.130242 Transcript_68439/m.130242 type:complete len:381 (+) Transcript_68439:97-1239(+)